MQLDISPERFSRLIALVLLLIIAGVGKLCAQRVLIQEAEQWYEAHAYSRAIPLLEEVLSKEGKAARFPHAALKLAECYRLTGDLDQAAAWYAKALPSPAVADAALAEFFLQYARVLQIRDACDQALPWFQAFASARPDDPRAAAGLLSCEQTLNMHVAPFELLNLSLNTTAHEFGASVFQGELWFSSSRSKGISEGQGSAESDSENVKGSRKNADHSDPWTGQAYLDFYYSPDWQAEEAVVHPAPFPLNSEWHDGPGQINASGDLMIFTRTRISQAGKGLEKTRSEGLALYTSRKVGRHWSAPEQLNLGQGQDDALLMHPCLSADGKTLIFASNAPGGAGGFDLYQSVWNGREWSAAEWLGPELNSAGDELYPHLDWNNNLWFASDGHPGFGGLDLFIAHKKKKDLGWLPPSLLARPLNSNYDDFGLIWLKTDTLGIMASNRPGGMGGDDLYEVSRSWRAYVGDEIELVLDSVSGLSDRETVNLLGQVLHSTSGESAGGGQARVLLAPAGDTVLVMDVDDQGYFGGAIPIGEAYLLEMDKLNYIAEPVFLDTRDMQPGEELTVMPQVREMRPDLVVEMNNIYYDYGKHHIRGDAEPDLMRLLRLMKDYPEMRIELSSHTDSRSSDAYNQQLSQRRAESARDFLVRRGVESSRIEALGYGESRLRNHCADEVPCSEEEHQFNRRTEFRITYFDAVLDSKPREFAPGTVPSPFGDQNAAALASSAGSNPAAERAAQSAAQTSAQQPGQSAAQAAARQALQSQKEHPDAGKAQGWDNAANPWTRGTWYGVQVGIDRQDNSRRFDGFSWLGGIRIEPSAHGFYRYVIGYFDRREEAEQVMGAIREAGIGDAFVVTYNNAQRNHK